MWTCLSVVSCSHGGICAAECQRNCTLFLRRFKSWAVFTSRWQTHLLESRVVIISCGSVNPSLLVRPGCSRPPSDLQVKSCFCVRLLSNLKKPDSCREECPPACFHAGFECETFALPGTHLCFDLFCFFKILLRSGPSLLVALHFDHRPS